MKQIRLRWFQTYDKNGVDSEKILQYWDFELNSWIDVNEVRVKDSDELESLQDPFAH